jgi:V8-like Glu-specific endopeptidase
MTASTKASQRAAETEHESPGAGGATGGAPSSMTTEFESPNGLDLNNTNPDTESTNTRARSVAVGESDTSEAGIVGATPGEFDEVSAVDAIVGSYPELAESVEVIIGVDERIRVTNTTTYPWSAICALGITAANGRRFIGTGWMISPRTVVTAGHCVYLHEEGGWAQSITVIPGCNDAVEPYGSHVGTDLRSVTGWTSSKNRDHDYGVIILPPSTQPGATTGTFGFATRTDAFLLNAALNLSGYPGDKGGRQQWFMAQRPKSVSEHVITYDIDTMGGQSGSPVWVLENGGRFGVGVHTNGHSSGNSATRITSGVFNNLSNWKNLGM